MKFPESTLLHLGIGYTTLDLRNESYQPIVGGNRKSLGFCVTHNYLVFNNDVILRPYPRDRPPGYSCPTLIYMYLDLDDALLSFGSDDEYWGVAFNFGNFKRNLKRPFHFMVGARGMVGKFMLFYKGRGECSKRTSQCFLWKHSSILCFSDVDSLHNAAPDLALPLEPQTSERRADPEDATTEATPAECTQFPHKASGIYCIYGVQNRKASFHELMFVAMQTLKIHCTNFEIEFGWL